jgi:hypothetical protein
MPKRSSAGSGSEQYPARLFCTAIKPRIPHENGWRTHEPQRNSGQRQSRDQGHSGAVRDVGRGQSADDRACVVFAWLDKGPVSSTNLRCGMRLVSSYGNTSEHVGASSFGPRLLRQDTKILQPIVRPLSPLQYQWMADVPLWQENDHLQLLARALDLFSIEGPRTRGWNPRH